MAQRPSPVTMWSPLLRRRAMMRVLGAGVLADFGRRLAGATSATPFPDLSSASPIVEIVVAALPAGSLEVHVAHVIVPAGVSLPASTPSGVRLLVVEAGTLAVELVPETTTGLLARSAPPGRRLVVPAGGSIALEAAAVAGVGSGGLKPAVFLDAAVFHVGERPPDRAFTTADGVGFQVLAGGEAGPPPEAACAVAIARRSIPGGTDAVVSGMALLYAEAGSGWAAHEHGAVRYARAAAQAPGSTAGALRALVPNQPAPLTAGSALLLGRADRARIGNEGKRPLRVLLVTVHSAVRPVER